MSSSALQVVRTKAFRHTGLPIVGIVVVALFLIFFHGMQAGYSALLGGVVWLLPNFYFAHKVFSKTGTANTLLRRFYRAEIIKLLLSAVLFILICRFYAVTMPTFLLGFATAQLMFWLTPLLIARTV